MYFRCCGYHYYEGNFNHFEQVAAGPQTGRSSPQNHLKKANSGWPLAHRTVAVYHRTCGRWRPPIADNPLVLTELQSSVVYAGAFDNADLEYILEPGSLKENIVLQNASATAEYSIEYKYNTLTVFQVDKHTVEFRDSAGQPVFVLYAPYMTDAAGKTSTALTLEITKNKKNSCTITMSADENWLLATDRVYPVTLDPLLVTSQAWSSSDNIQSCYISSDYPDTSYGRGGTSYEGSMYVGNSPDRGRVRTLMKVPTLPSLDIGDKVVHAEIAAYVTYCYPGCSVTVHRVLSDWTQSTATWNSDIDFYPLECEYQIIDAMSRDESRNDRWERFEITDLVRGWYSGEYPNYGVMLTGSGEYSSSTNHVWFLSSDIRRYLVCGQFYKFTTVI